MRTRVSVAILSTVLAVSAQLALPQSTTPVPATFSLIQGPWSGPGVGTFPSWINDHNDIVGAYTGGSGSHGFVKLHDCAAGQTGPTCGRAYTLDAPATPSGSTRSTALLAITNGGLILGDYVDAGGVSHGALWSQRCSSSECTLNFQSIDPPGAVMTPTSVNGTNPTGISENGTIVGIYFDSSLNLHGFMATPQPPGETAASCSTSIQYDYSDITIPSVDSAYPKAISASGIVTGIAYLYSASTAGFVRSLNGDITVFSPPNANTVSPVAVNSSGYVVGQYYANVPPVGNNSFLVGPDNIITQLQTSWPVSINEQGVIVLGDGTNRGSLRKPDGSVSYINAPTGWTGWPTHLNNFGWITGYVWDRSGTAQGFIGKP